MVREWETRHKNSEKSEDQGTNTAPRWRCWNWIQASFIILSAMNERIYGELNYNSCGFQGQRTKWSLTIEQLGNSNKSVTKTDILIYRFSTRYVKHVTLRSQFRNSLGSVFWPLDHILFSSLWTVPSGFVLKVSCLIASSLSITIHFFCGPCQGLLFFYSSCLLCHPTILSPVIPFFCLQSFPATVSFQWVGSSHKVSKILELQFQHQFFQGIFRTDFL